MSLSDELNFGGATTTESLLNNAPDNIEVMPSHAHHHAEHRKQGSNLRLPGERNPLITCACGCGARFRRFDALARPRRFRSGHNTSERNREARHG